jgi:hypothetical protein
MCRGANESEPTDLLSLTFIELVLTGDVGVLLIHVIERIANEMGYALEFCCFQKAKAIVIP